MLHGRMAQAGRQVSRRVDGGGGAVTASKNLSNCTETAYYKTRMTDGSMDNNIFDDIKKRVDLVEIIKEDYPLKGH